MQTFTPAPWITDTDKSFYVFADAGDSCGRHVICNASTQANQRLIAAAPDMAKALQMLVDSSPGKQFKAWTPPQKILSAAIDALAKAGL